MELTGKKRGVKKLRTNRMDNAMERVVFRISKKMLEALYKYKLHIILWLIYITYESMMVGVFTGAFGKFENYAVHYTLNVSLFYFHSYSMEKINFKKRKLDYLKVLLLVILEITAYVIILAILNHLFTAFNQPNKYNILGIDERYIIGASYRSLSFILVSSGYWFLINFYKEREISANLEKQHLHSLIEKEAMTKQLLMAQNAYLKAQINPHFLFNTLSFIHRRVRKIDEDAGNLVVSLADMMRYALDISHSEEYIVLSKEIEQVENLINLFQIKEDFKLYIFFDYEEAAAEEKLIPLALMTLAENIFKHGVLTDVEHPAKISLRYANEMIIIETENKVGEVPGALSLKTGLSNLKDRLRHAYGQKCSITWEKNDGYFRVRLTVSV